jgi:Uma2 family endonuclease
MTTETRLMTAEELWQLPDDGQRHELIEGVLTTMAPPGGEHGNIAVLLSFGLQAHMRANKLGKVVVESGFIIRRNPDVVLSPDAAFISYERLPGGVLSKGFIDGIPDLVAEIISPDDLYTEVAEKVAKWLAAGTLMVLVINPRHRTVTVHRPTSTSTPLTEEDQIEGADAVPGWTMSVRELFE